MSKFLAVIAFLFCFHTSFAQDETVENSGDVVVFMMPAVVFGTTLIKEDYKGTWQFTKAAVVNVALTLALKKIINKPRPNLQNNNSFPSGHTSVTFQSASFAQRRYGWKFGIPAYLLAGYTGFSRIQANKHDIYDVLAGAIIGVGSTYLFTTPYQQEHMELAFSGGKDEFLIGFRFKF